MSTDRYNVKAVEKKWQKHWSDNETFVVTEDTSKPKYYVLEMFPYPSGRIHVGHIRNFALGDLTARFRRKLGFNVLYPMGWDAFGLPAENAARDRGEHPGEWTYKNIDNMREQLKSMGLSYDWSRELATCDPDYFKHEQKLFIDFYKKDIAYRKEAYVNWDPVDHTVLANEQVIDGRGWRSGALVEKRKLTQWFFRITDYAADLLDALKELEQWPDKIRLMQTNWIGRSEGAEIHFELSGGDKLNVFTTRPDTIFGAAFCAVSVDHPLTLAAAENNKELQDFIAECKRQGTTEAELETAEKMGYKLSVTAKHPFLKDVELPVYVANFILMDYGTGAIFGCPAHDQRDLDFARKYNLPVLPVVAPKDQPDIEIGDEAYTDPGVIINSDFLNGLPVDKAKSAAIDALKKQGQGESKITYRLRDWGVSRQRYWGCPIPMVHCDACGVVPVAEKDLPITLPKDATFDKPGNPLDHHPTWKHTTCPECGSAAVRDTDTFDTFMESSWYFARYCSPKYEDGPFDTAAADYWLPVDQYIGGAEHAVLHLLYSRFYTRALRDCGYLKISEPFTGLKNQGMINHETYKDQNDKWLYPEEVKRLGEGSYVKIDGESPVKVGPAIKMSKSKHNTVDPEPIIAAYGADTIRLFVLSDSPPERDLEWSEQGLDGAWRYINRVWRMVNENLALLTSPPSQPGSDADSALKLRQATHKTIDAVTNEFKHFGFNRGVARIRELTNAIAECEATDETVWARYEAITTLIQLLYPITPHLCEELWATIGQKESLTHSSWPETDSKLLVKDTVTIAVQVNGKLRATLDMPVDTPKDVLEKAAIDLPIVKKYLNDNAPKKVIVVPNKIVNVVV